MKVAVLKLGGRIANAEHGITSFEAVSVAKMLSMGGFEVDCFTKISERDKPIPELNIKEITEHHEEATKNYDALVVLNGNINFYGGAETPEQLLNLKIINNFDGPVLYMFIDTLLPLVNIWKSVEKKPRYLLWCSGSNSATSESGTFTSSATLWMISLSR